MPVTLTLDELEQAEDLDLGVSEWHTITQDQIEQFADATLDHQWIHVDPDRAAEGPFGTTIAHGYLTLSLLPHFTSQLIEVSDVAMGVNYGLDRLRLTNPVPSGSRVRARGVLKGAQRKAGGVLFSAEITVEIEGEDRPALVAEALFLNYPDA